MSALIIRPITGRITAMDRITGTVIGIIEAGEAIGTTEAMGEGMAGTRNRGTSRHGEKR